MDSWSKTQLERMKNGGNAKLRKFWRDQTFPSNLSSKGLMRKSKTNTLLVINQLLEIE